MTLFSAYHDPLRPVCLPLLRAGALCSLLSLGVQSCKAVSLLDLQRWKSAGENSGGAGASSGQGEAVGEQRLADSSGEIKAASDFYINLWSKNFTTKLADLPVSASVPDDKVPYSGYWYPQKFGGTNARLKQGDQTPLEKYDRAYNGGQSKAADWERDKHSVSANDPSAPWAGHCNGYSAAAQRHARPKKAVTKGGVTFEIQDIKALLAEIHMSAKYLFLGGRRCESDGRISTPNDRPDPTKMGDCEDINPGTFHAAVANWIGKANHTLVFDISIGYQVWNYPLYKYSSTVTTISKSDAAQRITGSSAVAYKFNPAATQFSYVVMTATHAEALGYEPIGNTGPISQPQSRSYTYVLELNDKGEIIGGEWTGQSQSDHPDFLWVAFEPVAGNGSSLFGNPHVDPDQVIKLWAESIGADPANPPLDIKEPAYESTWGKYSNYDLTLDGSSSGAVFMGKKIRLAVGRKADYVGAVTLELGLDGGAPQPYVLDGTGPVIHDFEATAGLHHFDLVWKKSGAVVERQTVNFHVNP